MTSLIQEEMRVAMELKRDGWVYDTIDLSVMECHDRANWCRDAFGPMFDNITWAGKWYGAILPFQTGSIVPNRQFVFMCRDDKLYTIYRMMWPE